MPVAQNETHQPWYQLCGTCWKLPPEITIEINKEDAHMSSKRSALCPVLFTILCPVPCPLHCPLYIQDIHLALSNAHNTYFWDHFKTSQMIFYCINIQRLNMPRMCTGLHGCYMVYGIVTVWNIVRIWDISAMAPFCWFVSIISFATPCAPSARLSDRRYLWS